MRSAQNEMTRPKKQHVPPPAEIAGDPGALLSRLGAPKETGVEAPLVAGVPKGRRAIHTVADLKEFLCLYRDQVLLGIEVPAILRAARHTELFEPRELIALDQELSANPLLNEWSESSWFIGRSQLRQLSGFKDNRLLQRYSEAVKTDRAKGWHMVVFGVTLATYSLPHRPALRQYALDTLRGFVHGPSCPIPFESGAAEKLILEITACLPESLNRILENDPRSRLQLL